MNVIIVPASDDTVIVLPASHTMSQRKNFEADAGDDITLAVRVRPVRDITTWSLECVFTDRTGAVKLTLLSSDSSAFLLISGPDGNANFILSTLNSGTTLGPGEWNYKVKRTDNTKNATLVRGRLSLKGD